MSNLGPSYAEMGESQREFGKNVIGQLVGGLGFGKGGTLLDVLGMAYDEGCVGIGMDCSALGPRG